MNTGRSSIQKKYTSSIQNTNKTGSEIVFGGKGWREKNVSGPTKGTKIVGRKKPLGSEKNPCRV